MSDDSTRTTTFTRRQAAGLAGGAGAALLLTKVSGPDRLLESIGLDDTAQAATTSCVLVPAKTEGPYFVDEGLNRSDIRTDPSDGTTQAGSKLNLTMVVVRADGNCAAVEGAIIDIWHANASGKYSDIASEGTSGRKFLRGLQATDANGQAKFTSIFPGWYSGRAVHIHFKVRVFDGTTTTYEFNSQLFFDPALENTILTTASPYSGRGAPNTPNSADNIYGTDGAKLLVTLTPDGSGGYSGTFVVGLAGLPSTTGGGTSNSVAAGLYKTRFRRKSGGRRYLRVTSAIGETVDVRMRLSRNGKTIVKRTVTGVDTGVKTLSVRVPRLALGGAAKLSVRYKDGSGLTKTETKSIKVPKRRKLL
jgi:protocatechuate 3,4-dioxygenase beta subunit